MTRLAVIGKWLLPVFPEDLPVTAASQIFPSTVTVCKFTMEAYQKWLIWYLRLFYFWLLVMLLPNREDCDPKRSRKFTRISERKSEDFSINSHIHFFPEHVCVQSSTCSVPPTLYYCLSTIFLYCLLQTIGAGAFFELPLVIPTDQGFTSYTPQILSQTKTGKKIIWKLPLHRGGKSFQMP